MTFMEAWQGRDSLHLDEEMSPHGAQRVDAGGERRSISGEQCLAIDDALLPELELHGH